ncbi:MAG: 4Fe-4S binding protein [Planctomycetes bacterium]|nr:4Fe-4S binding protein [Planctomycetota bacterium]
MSTIVYWFSGTGNSLHLARRIAEGLGDTELVSIAHAMRAADPPRTAERVGLVFPVYAWGPPGIVHRFIERLVVEGKPYVFAAFTCGGSAGSTAAITRKLLRRRGLDLAAAWSVRMVENYPPLGGAPAPDAQQRHLAAADRRIGEIVGSLKAFPAGVTRDGNPLFGLLGPLIHPLFLRDLPRMDRKFTADDTCIQCGLCAQICPVGNIDLVDGRPRWLGRCEQCYACFHFCPTRAIQRGRTARQHRYHHPDVSAADLTGGASSQGQPGETP